MPPKPKKTKMDGFYSVASSILRTAPKNGAVRMKLSTRRIIRTVDEVQPIERFKCIRCFKEHNVFERNIKGRILRGYLVTKNGRTSIQDYPGVPVLPTYHTGRLGEECFHSFAVSAHPPTDYKTIQLLKDVSKEYHKTPTVTLGMVEAEDALQEVALEAAIKDARPKHKGLAIDVGKVGIADNPQKDLDVNAFRRFMMNRKGGVKDYHDRPATKLDDYQGQFDSEVNFANQKRSQ